MSLQIAQSFNNNSLLIVEAGTGIGKSLAYLFPALYAIRNNERVVISTNTINLQSQLLNKDIPFVKEVLGTELEAVLVKGRRNYLCKLKLYHLDEELEFTEEQEEINEIKSWSNSTKNGSIDELNFVPNNTIWEKVCSDSDFCMGSKCMFYRDCFLQQARRKASEAHILIVNHHILFADLQIRAESGNINENILLPPYKKIIFDEAHNIEKAASSYFTINFSKAQFYKFINHFRGKKQKSYLRTFMTRLVNNPDKNLYAIGEYMEREIIQGIEKTFSAAIESFEIIQEYLHAAIEKENNNYQKLSLTLRILPQEWESTFFIAKVLKPLGVICDHLLAVKEAFLTCVRLFEELPEASRSKFEYDINNLEGYTSKVKTFHKDLSQLITSTITHKVAWLEIFGDQDRLFFPCYFTIIY